MCVLVAAVVGCTRTRVVIEEVPVEVPIIRVIPDTSFAAAYSRLMENVLAQTYSVDTLSVSATRSDTLRAISIDLQYSRLLRLALKRFWLQM